MKQNRKYLLIATLENPRPPLTTTAGGVLGSILQQGHLRLPKMEEAMHLIESTTLRRLVPGFAVAGVLAFSAFASVPSLASNGASGYGYGNNCGVKGTGYHDHGKVCPNRPFPGKGITEAAGTSNSTSAGNDTTTSSTNRKGNPANPGNATTVVSTSTQSVTGEDASSTGKGHGNGKGHGRGNSKH
jgi:hypothetical protein